MHDSRQLELKRNPGAGTRAQSWRRPLAALAVSGMMIMSLSACVGVAVGGAVVGTMAATDRRTLGAQTEDKAIELKAANRARMVVGDAGQVSINSYNRKVLVTGEVRDQAMKTAVEREVAAVEAVQEVINELAIAGPSSLTSRSNDSLLTGKVKASLIDAKDVSSNAIRVSTERGVVYLMGRVSQGEANRATEVARGVSGVQKVVRVFEYITEGEAQQYYGPAKTETSN